MTWTRIVLLLIVLSSAHVAPVDAQATRLVPERGPNASMKDGLLQLRGASGWLRFPRPVLDFEIAFEIRALTPEADPGLIVRTWTGREQWPDRGYRLALPSTGPLDPSSMLQGRRQNVAVLRHGTLDLRPAGEWQRVQVVARGPRIRVVVNDLLAGEFEVESYGGFVMVDNRKGRVELRNLTLAADEPSQSIPGDTLVLKQLEASGGRGPEVVHEVRPLYSLEATRAMARGMVSMDAVVLEDGSVGPIRLTRTLHPDLDVSAIAALKAWRFRPASLNGRPVAVVVEVQMTFVLR